MSKLLLKAKEIASEIKKLAEVKDGEQITGETATKVTDLQTELAATMALVEGVKVAEGVIEFADAPAGDDVKHLTPTEQRFKKLSDLLPDWDEFKGFTPVSGEFDTKTLFVGDAVAGATVPDYGPMALMPKEMLSVRSIFGSGATGSDTAKYLKQVLRTNATDFVSQTGAYPESAFGFEWQTDNVVKLGHSLPVSDDTLADRGQMAAILDGEMTYGVAYKIDRALITGSGDGDEIEGILNRENVQVFDSGDSGFELGADDAANASQHLTVFDIVRHMITKATHGSAVGFVPDFVGLDGTIAEMLDLVKDSTGRYLMYAADGRIWRLPIVESPAFTAATTHHVLVGPGKVGAQVLSRRGTNVEVGYVNAQFLNDTKTIKASERLLFKVPYPVAFVDWSVADAEIAALVSA